MKWPNRIIQISKLRSTQLIINLNYNDTYDQIYNLSSYDLDTLFFFKILIEIG
jgi:hypothetical protein